MLKVVLMSPELGDLSPAQNTLRKCLGQCRLQLLCYLDNQLANVLGLNPEESLALALGRGKVPRVCFQTLDLYSLTVICYYF